MKDKSIRAVLKNICWLIFDKIFILGMNMVVIFIIANYYGPEKYGLYQYATNIVLVLEIVVQLIDGRVIKKQYNDTNNDQVVFNVTIAKVSLSCIALMFGIVIIIVSGREADFSFMLLFLMIDSIVKNLRFGMENRFEYFLQSKRVVIAADVGLFIGTLMQFVAVLAKTSIKYIAAIQVVASTISLIVLYTQYRNKFKNQLIQIKVKLDKSFIYKIVKESLPLAIASSACVIYTRCDSVMLGMLLSTTEVGIYSISSKLISAVQMLIVPIQTTVYIKMIEWHKDSEKYEKNYLRITSLTTWIAIIGIMCSFIVLPFVFKLLNPAYLPALNTYKILSISTIFTYNAILRSCHFTITENGRILMTTQIITVLINILLNYLLINIFGLNGAAMATVAAQFIALFLSNAFYKDAKFVFRQQIKGFNPVYIFKK